MTESSDAAALSEWVAAVARELGIDEVPPGTVDLVLDLTADVAHGVSRPGAPVTAFLVGIAVGRSADPASAGTHAATVSALAEAWPAGRGA
jgi:Domain of unknown function (DUF6457)